MRPYYFTNGLEISSQLTMKSSFVDGISLITYLIANNVKEQKHSA